MKIRKHSAFTLIELLVVIGIIGILATLGFGAFKSAQKAAKLAASLSNVKQIGISMKLFSNDNNGSYPVYIDQENPGSGLLATSNEAFESLMPRYLTDKKLFGNQASQYCKGAVSGATSTANQYKVLSNENDWCYVASLSDTSDSRWPLVMTALAPGTTNYVKDSSQKGGVWEGTDAIILNADASASKAPMVKDSEPPIVGRPDKPKDNRFVPVVDEWIGSGTVLYPMN